MGAADPTLIAGSLTEDEARAVVDGVDANDTIVDPHIMDEVLAMTRTSIIPPSANPVSAYPASRSVPPVALPSLPPPPSHRPAADATHAGFVAAALVTAALVVGALAAPQLMVHRDRTWVAPATLSMSDPSVLEVAQSLDKARVERVALDEEMHRITARLRELEEQQSPADYETALASELTKRRLEQKRLQTTIDERDRQLIPPSSELGSKLKSTEKQITALKAAKKGLSNEPALIAEKRELTTKAATVALAQRANDEHRQSLDASPYRAAVDADALLAWVPEENLTRVREGSVLTCCRWGTFVCTDVGMVTEVFGEPVDRANPITGDRARGRFVRVTWADESASRRQMLFSR